MHPQRVYFSIGRRKSVPKNWLRDRDLKFSTPRISRKDFSGNPGPGPDHISWSMASFLAHRANPWAGPPARHPGGSAALRHRLGGRVPGRHDVEVHSGAWLPRHPAEVSHQSMTVFEEIANVVSL